ncbi:MAG: hypothetical protein IT343_02475 [Candidatus Melainabacteria bacterium]|jgi:hypothetical protein|nr:hypothetical protein [Candidatus Melainabacteria bacterium]
MPQLMPQIRRVRNKTIFSLLLAVAAGSQAIVCAAAPAKPKAIQAIHAVQQHNKLGRGDLYVAGLDVKWIFNDGDVYFMYKGKERKVYLACTSKKSVFEQPFAQFKRKGIHFTQGGQDAFNPIRIKPLKTFVLQGFPVKIYTMLAEARAGGGELRLVDIGSITALAEPTKTPEMAEFITTSYGLKKIDSVMLELKTRFYAEDGSLWFKTSTKDLPQVNNTSNQARLRTSKLEKIMVAGDFFEVPKDYKKAASQEAIMGMASATRDFEDLLFAEPGSKK